MKIVKTTKYELSEQDIQDIIKMHFEEKYDKYIRIEDINLYNFNHEIYCDVELEEN